MQSWYMLVMIMKQSQIIDDLIRYVNKKNQQHFIAFLLYD